MTRTTIDFGIDLGTTNSTVCVIDQTDARVVPNKLGATITPSAVWLNKRGQMIVGQDAKFAALMDDQDNADVEFKLRMGLGANGKKVFTRSGKEFLPEELSAEVLKELKKDVMSSMSEAISCAVITVPAAFELPQTNATQKAAGLAGLLRSPLLLEPVAASLAYGFQTRSENVYWLVYDFGGGTFDSAVMRVRDGLIQVVNHDGDNHLGGKLIDWDIVTKLMIPALTSEFNLPDFRRGNERWRHALGKLKYHAETAKIEVCRTKQPHEVWVEGLCKDADGRDVDFTFTLKPSEIAQVSRPFVERSLGLCRKTLGDKGLSGADLERILLVGGTTLNPWVREAVQAELGSRVEFGIDPVTVVARGAAIFASTVPQPKGATEQVAPGVWVVEVEHEPVGNVPDPDIGGRVLAPKGGSPKGFSIEFVDVKTQWRSGLVALGADGVFMTQLFADDRRRCEYSIELCDPTGTKVPTSPLRLVYTLGVVPDKPPASMTIGVGLQNDEMRPYIQKGMRLPARKMHVHRTTKALRSGNAEDQLLIPILEGENARATRNHGIGELVIRGTDIRRDLQVGSDIEITMFVDESQQVRVEALVTMLDEDFEVSFNPRMECDTLDSLRKTVRDEKGRLAKLKRQADQTRSPKAVAAVSRIGEEQILDEVDTLIDAAEQDADALTQLDRRVRGLRAAIDHVEDAVELPTLLAAAQESLNDAEAVVGSHGDHADHNDLEKLRLDLKQATDSADPDLVRHQRDNLDRLWWRVQSRRPEFHVNRFNGLAKRLESMRDVGQAEQIIAQGRRAINSNDIEAIKAANRQLGGLLPRDEQTNSDRRIGNII